MYDDSKIKLKKKAEVMFSIHPHVHLNPNSADRHGEFMNRADLPLRYLS
jgi:hypothetical protein